MGRGSASVFDVPEARLCVLVPDSGRGSCPEIWPWARFVSEVVAVGAVCVLGLDFWARFVSWVLAVGAGCVLVPECGRGLCPGS